MSKRKIKTLSLLLALGSSLLLPACAEVSRFERGYVNDPAMEGNMDPCDRYRAQVKVYREGAAGANGSKSGGGCGCY